MSASTTPQFRWDSPDATWEALPAEARDLIVATGTRRWTEIQAGVQSFNEQWRPLRQPIMTQDTFDALHEVSARVLDIILQACRRRAATAGELRRAMGIAEGEIALLMEDDPLTEDLLVAGRPDILMSGGVPKFVEFNIDSALGGALDSDMLSARFAKAYLADGITDRYGLHAPASSVDGRYRAIADWLGPDRGARLAMVMDLAVPHAGLVDAQAFLDKFAPFAAQGAAVAGLDVVPYWLQWLTVDEQQRLVAGGEVVPAVLRMLIPDKAADCAGLRALETALRAGTVRMFTPSATWLLSNKIVLAWLWEDLDQLDEADQAVVRAHIPRTRQLDASLIADALSRQPDVVLKPGGGSAGVDVLLGRDADPEQWRAAVHRAVERGGFLLQDYVESDLLSMDFVDMHTGTVVHQAVPWCFGPYLYGRVRCGGIVRLGFPGGGAVMNIDRGALLSGVSILASG